MQCRGKWSFAADLPALERLVAGEEVAAQRVPLVEDHRETTVDLAQAVLHAHHRQGRGDRPALVSGVADAPRHAGAQPDQPLLSVDETSRIVCIAVGAQWPILRRLEKPRRR